MLNDLFAYFRDVKCEGAHVHSPFSVYDLLINGFPYKWGTYTLRLCKGNQF